MLGSLHKHNLESVNLFKSCIGIMPQMWFVKARFFSQVTNRCIICGPAYPKIHCMPVMDPFQHNTVDK